MTAGDVSGIFQQVFRGWLTKPETEGKESLNVNLNAEALALLATSGAPVLGAGENFIGSVGGKSINVTPTITTSATLYTTGDCVGGVLTLTDAARIDGKQTILQSLHIKDASNQKVPLTILIFESNPTGGTGFTATDNAAFSYGSDTATYAKQIGKINVVAGDYETIDSKATAVISGLGRIYTPVGSNDLFAVIITTGGPTYGANATSLYATFGFLQD
jgi:hypothetical protein